jgi:ABC-type nitrate/sulfonate/bicarbonate transport system ATPase subunit/ABC-type transporter Mla maintaining outer membrane lipid asymmetry permease subunit MlaE
VSVVSVSGLNVSLPDGSSILEDVDFSLGAGEVISLLGPSGAGKTTAVQAIFSPSELLSRGYAVAWTTRKVTSGAAFVPQRGALIDHLDVAGNIALAQAGGGLRTDVEPWLQAVDLDHSPGFLRRPTSALSGGQAQRVAVARVLAAGRKLVVLDEPSVGLDPLGVRSLAQLLVKQAREQGASILIITHDLSLAAGASDHIYYLDPTKKSLGPIDHKWEGPAELASPEQRQRSLVLLEETIEQLLRQQKPRKSGNRKLRAFELDLFDPIRVVGEAILRLLDPRLLPESFFVLLRGINQALIRPLFFYVVVGLLLGITVPYVVVHISASLRPSALLSLIGGTYIQALAPPLSAIVFAATSGSALNAWLGGLRLNGQVLALEGLGVAPSKYLWAPSFYALTLSYLATFLAFAGSMTLGGWLLFSYYHVPFALDRLTADFLDPPASRFPYLIRCVWLVLSYSIAISSIVVSRGRAAKRGSEDVTAAMTSSVIRSTLFVVAMELATVVALFSLTGNAQ